MICSSEIHTWHFYYLTFWVAMISLFTIVFLNPGVILLFQPLLTLPCFCGSLKVQQTAQTQLQLNPQLLQGDVSVQVLCI